MPSAARAEIVAAGEVGFYHCISRCVRRACLCGDDGVTGRNFDHRKEWVRQRIGLLAQVFAIDVCAYAAMSNHLHLLLRIRPDLAEKWTAEEVASRWLKLSGSATAEQIETLAGNERRIAELRTRLASLSWFMRYLKEYIARRANAEEEVSGRFWEGRFTSQALLDEAAVLACAAYVDLNPIRAAIAETLEESDFTSVQQRIEERSAGDSRRPSSVVRLCQIDERDGGFLPLTRDGYLSLLDRIARLHRPCKPGVTPAALPPILERLNLSPDELLGFNPRFHRGNRVAILK
ncbi:transposase [Lignipirellula cremea]|uniref:Transposase IS200-like domain-containing protein n=1 Tax=Lignipirellula cremea TaxID=2528010 RepID=A0A518DVN9_9BACT|nr:transposase [Lignipirellula cremea]QDU95896.1 hypothetical protein Pla8534_37150 [Lignipirellula cremea]